MKTPNSLLVPRGLGIALAASILLSLSTPLRASLLIYEGFDRYTVGNIGGQTSTATGLTGNYAASATVNYQTNGLTFGNLLVSGGSVWQSGTTAANFGAQLAAGTVTGTIYASYLINFSSGGDSSSRAWSSIAQDSVTSGTRRFAALADNSTSANAAVGYTGVGSDATNSGVSLLGGTTYMVLASFSNVGSALSEENPGIATLWVITENQFSYFQANGFTDLNLNSANIGSGNSDVFARVTNTATSGTYTFANNRYLQLSLNANSSSRTYIMDEVRYGTLLADVAPIPEPSVMALSVLAALGLVHFARARRRTDFSGEPRKN